MEEQNKQQENTNTSLLHMKRKYFIWLGLSGVFIFIFFIIMNVNERISVKYLLQGEYSTKLSKIESDVCLSKGGTININYTGPNTSREYCLPNDVGNECLQENDCEGKCVINEGDIGNLKYDKNGFIIGTCNFYANGCYSDYIIKEQTKNKENLEQHQGVCF